MLRWFASGIVWLVWLWLIAVIAGKSVGLALEIQYSTLDCLISLSTYLCINAMSLVLANLVGRVHWSCALPAFALVLLFVPYCVLIQLHFGLVEFHTFLDNCAQLTGSRCVHPDAVLARALGVKLEDFVFWDQLAQSVLLEIAKFALPAIAIGLWRVMKGVDRNERIIVQVSERTFKGGVFAGDAPYMHPIPAPVSLESAAEHSPANARETIPSSMPQIGKVSDARHRPLAPLDVPIYPPSRAESWPAVCQFGDAYPRATHPWIRGPPAPT